jgi:hypothetical protein
MITTRELRTGLYFNVPRKDQCPFKIDLIEHLSDNYTKVGMSSGIYKLGEIEMEGHPLTWELKDLEPIPLNEEWFIKFGFKEDKFDFKIPISPCGVCELNIIPQDEEYSDCSVCVTQNEAEIDGANNVFLSDIKYVHQLQSLYFALTGEELTINEK